MDATHKVVAEGREAIKDVQRAEEFNLKVETVLAILDGLQEPPKPKKVGRLTGKNNQISHCNSVFRHRPHSLRVLLW